MALGCRRRSAPRGDVTVPCLRSPCCRALRPAVPRRLIASHAEITAPRSSSPLDGGVRSKARIRDAALSGRSRGAGATPRTRTKRGAPAGPGRWAGKEIDGIGPQRARNAAPRSGTRETGTCAQQHARPGATTSQQRRAGLPTARPSARPASSRRAGLPPASTPQRQQPSRRAAHSKTQ